MIYSYDYPILEFCDDCDWIMFGNVVPFDYEHDLLYIKMSVTCNVWFLCVWDVDAIVYE